MGKRSAEAAGLRVPSLLKKKKLNHDKKNKVEAQIKAQSKRAPKETTESVPPAQTPETPLRAKKRLWKEAAREEKRARKAAKKEKERAAAEALAASKPLSTEEEIAEKEARKAARRKQRVERAAKKAAKEADVDETSGTTTSGPSGVSSNANSNEVSSATSPEPIKAALDTELEALIAEPVPFSQRPKYIPHPDLDALGDELVDEFLKSKAITVAEPGHSKATLRPVIDFKYLPVEQSQMSVFDGFSSPTPIQAAAWPYLLAGKDVIGVAETGSGKTLAFGIPCVQHILKSRDKRAHVIKAVIVSPTRELAIQIYEQLQKLTESVDVKVVCVYGGVSKDEQKKQLKGADIVVATPGRLNDLIDEASINIRNAKYVVLDEADRMLDKGFEEDVRKIIGSTQPQSKRQTLMFTATWPESVRKLASTFMKDPVKINIGHATGELRANIRIEQVVEIVDPRSKQDRLLELLRKHRSDPRNTKSDRILVFCLYKKEADRTHSFLRSKGIKCAAIHGDMSQQQRLKSLDSFKSGETPCLIATDVAARGLDIPDVKLVINATFPLTAEDYVHRIGRTGRAGAEGKAITLFTEHDKLLAGSLINVLRAANQPVPEALLAFGTTVKKKEHEHYGAFYKDTENMKAATKITFDD